ncbi:hypothetical protein ACHQM5_016431 [Ranunculus cassubicifolius]
MIKERVITIEYLQPSMSQQLLSKFPDESAYDFDYTQSGIWSPLLPRGHSRMQDVSASEVTRKLLAETPEFPQEKMKKLSSRIKKKMSAAMRRKKKKGLDFSVSPNTNSAPKKGWAKVLKAASKSFKKHKVAPSLRLQNFLNLGEF